MLIESGRNINFAPRKVPTDAKSIIDLLSNIDEELSTGPRSLSVWEAESAKLPQNIREFRERIALTRLHPYPILPLSVLPKHNKTAYEHAFRTRKIPRPLVIPTDLSNFTDEAQLIEEQRAALFVFRIEAISQTPYLMRCDESMYFDEDNRVGEPIK